MNNKSLDCSGIQLLNMWWICLLLYPQERDWLQPPDMHQPFLLSITLLLTSPLHTSCWKQIQLCLGFPFVVWQRMRGGETLVSRHRHAWWSATFGLFRCAKIWRLLTAAFCYYNWLLTSLFWFLMCLAGVNAQSGVVGNCSCSFLSHSQEENIYTWTFQASSDEGDALSNDPMDTCSIQFTREHGRFGWKFPH